MNRLGELYLRLVRAVIASLLCAMMVLVFGNVVLRYAFNLGWVVSEELSRIFFVWIVFLGATLAMAEHGHIGIDTLVRRLPAAAARTMIAISGLVILFCAGLMARGSWIQFVINIDVVTPATGLPMAVFYAAGLVFGVVAMVIVLADLWRTLGPGGGAVALVHGGAEGGDEAVAAAIRPRDEAEAGRTPR